MAELDLLLIKTSRTFALSIPCLREPIRRQVTIAYLLYRIADTFEDAVHWSKAQQIDALEKFGQLLQNNSALDVGQLAATWKAQCPIQHEGYIELLAEIPQVIESYLALPEPAMEKIKHYALQTVEGMAGIVSRSSDGGGLQLKDIPDLRQYCYIVAGIVGEMLTELFLLECESLQEMAPYLRERASRFGEGLQLVNILKDSEADTQEGRCYLPVGIDRKEIFALARSDLEAAVEYVLALQRGTAPVGFLGFTGLPILLAWATLDRVEELGPGAKISRDEVSQIFQFVKQSLERNHLDLSPQSLLRLIRESQRTPFARSHP
jgi:farnesyl-diphosphate farnesyltransferase